ncbi:MAG: RiPP maturation radical SAM C-methyltransferase [Candidatus Bathyarchaeia archaeon]|jgi:ribosomal peptide maturation radical SAM protein 1
MPPREVDVLLAFMPFGNTNYPSLGLSLLKAGLRTRAIESRIAYYNLAFAKSTGIQRYMSLSSNCEFFLGEWIFSQLASGFGNPQDMKAHDEALVGLLENIDHAKDARRKRAGESQEDLRAELIQTRDKAEAFVNSCVDDITRINPKILGFSTMFSQNCSSLAVARRIKERQGANAPIVIFGGSNCEGIMGYSMLKLYPWIDYVCCGEGDKVFLDFVDGVVNGNSAKVPGIVGRSGDHLDQFSTPPPVRNMDDLPIPEFEDYFQALRTLGLEGLMTPRLAIETSRGCWWGDISHCTFCGLNGLTMKYRGKTADRLLKEMDDLLQEWGPHTIQVVDNILSLDFFKSLFPEVIRRRVKLNLFFETKSNLKREQLRLLKTAGVRGIQPGIESLSDDTLNLMGKGVTGLQNIWLLKACREMGIAAYWNWLAGFPNEKPSEYERMKRWVPLLYHLQPPGQFGSIHLDRFSPLFNFQKKFGIHNVRAARPYRLIYAFDDKTLYDLAYYFDFDYEDGRDPEEYAAGLGDEILKWMREWNVNGTAMLPPLWPAFRRPIVDKFARPFLVLLGAPVPAMFGAPVLAKLDLRTGVLIWDTRPCASRTLFALKGLDASIFRYTNDVRTYDAVVQHFVDLGYASADIQRALSNLMERKLVILDSGRCLALAPKVTVSMILARILSGYVRRLAELVNLIHRKKKC